MNTVTLAEPIQRVRSKSVRTPPAIVERIEKALNTHMDQLCYLFWRWQDEHEYEDWKEYVSALSKCVPEGAIFLRAGRSPFRVEFEISDGDFAADYRYFVGRRDVGWKRI